MDKYTINELVGELAEVIADRGFHTRNASKVLKRFEKYLCLSDFPGGTNKAKRYFSSLFKLFGLPDDDSIVQAVLE